MPPPSLFTAGSTKCCHPFTHLRCLSHQALRVSDHDKFREIRDLHCPGDAKDRGAAACSGTFSHVCSNMSASQRAPSKTQETGRDSTIWGRPASMFDDNNNLYLARAPMGGWIHLGPRARTVGCAFTRIPTRGSLTDLKEPHGALPRKCLFIDLSTLARGSRANRSSPILSSPRVNVSSLRYDL
jgi:hypothetical protein